MVTSTWGTGSPRKPPILVISLLRSKFACALLLIIKLAAGRIYSAQSHQKGRGRWKGENLVAPSKCIKITTVLIVSLLVACAAPQVEIRTEYQKVYIPVPCSVGQPPRPKASDSVELMVIDLIEYTRLLEVNLNICTGDVRLRRPTHDVAAEVDN